MQVGRAARREDTPAGSQFRGGVLQRTRSDPFIRDSKWTVPDVMKLPRGSAIMSHSQSHEVTVTLTFDLQAPKSNQSLRPSLCQMWKDSLMVLQRFTFTKQKCPYDLWPLTPKMESLHPWLQVSVVALECHRVRKRNMKLMEVLWCHLFSAESSSPSPRCSSAR